MIIDLGPLTIKLDVLIIQFINIGILLYLFNKLFGETLIAEIAERRAMTRKLEQAEKEYAALLAEANAQKDAIIKEALEHKKSIIEEASRLAKNERAAIVEKAKQEADLIVLKAQRDAEAQKKDIEQKFEQWVKSTAVAMLKKLFASNKQVSDMYIAWLVDEFTHSYKA